MMVFDGYKRSISYHRYISTSVREVRFRLTVQFHLQYIPIFYTDLLLQSVADDVFRKRHDDRLFTVLYLKLSNSL
jgi:hypothetical protein